MPQVFQPLTATTGRALLGLYFILPGLSKIPGWDGTATLMTEKGMVLVGPFSCLPLCCRSVAALPWPWDTAPGSSLSCWLGSP